MFNFLPQKNKNQIIIEYLLRVLGYLLIFIFSASIILASLFVPTYFFSKYKSDAMNSQYKTINQQPIKNIEDPIALIKKVNRYIPILLDTSMTTVSYSDLINKVISLKNPDIKITSISIINSTTVIKTVSINGISNNRDSLTAFKKSLETDGFFDSVTFPVLDFIKSMGSEFSAVLVYKNK